MYALCTLKTSQLRAATFHVQKESHLHLWTCNTPVACSKEQKAFPMSYDSYWMPSMLSLLKGEVFRLTTGSAEKE